MLTSFRNAGRKQALIAGPGLLDPSEVRDGCSGPGGASGCRSSASGEKEMVPWDLSGTPEFLSRFSAGLGHQQRLGQDLSSSPVTDCGSAGCWIPEESSHRLAVCERIQASGGDVVLRSAVGSGAMVFLCLSRAAGSTRAVPRAVGRDDPRQASRAVPGKTGFSGWWLSGEHAGGGGLQFSSALRRLLAGHAAGAAGIRLRGRGGSLISTGGARAPGRCWTSVSYQEWAIFRELAGCRVWDWKFGD